MNDQPYEQLVGSIRRFGPVGPVYQILGFDQVDEAGEQWLKVVVLESGEQTQYKAVHALTDPVEG